MTDANFPPSARKEVDIMMIRESRVDEGTEGAAVQVEGHNRRDIVCARLRAALIYSVYREM